LPQLTFDEVEVIALDAPVPDDAERSAADEIQLKAEVE
jgi:hypothetical protein